MRYQPGSYASRAPGEGGRRLPGQQADQAVRLALLVGRREVQRRHTVAERLLAGGEHIVEVAALLVDLGDDDGPGHSVSDAPEEHRAPRHGQLRHEEVVRTEEGKEVGRVDLPIRYLVGSGSFARTYLVEVDGFQFRSTMCRVAAGSIVIVAVAIFVESTVLVARTVTALSAGTVAGARYSPVVETVP